MKRSVTVNFDDMFDDMFDENKNDIFLDKIVS